MLSGDPFFADLRAREFARLDEAGLAYLDHAAAALHGESQARAYAERLTRGVYGNPHSTHAASRASDAALEAARAATLAFFDADPDRYAVVFAANTTAAIKLVGESWAFGPRRPFVLAADNHNSVNGVREYARRAGAPVRVLPLDSRLRLDDPETRLASIAQDAGPGLFAYPLQSNFSGVRHPAELVTTAEGLGYDVLVDAAGAGPAQRFSLRDHPAAFVATAFYKLFGLPTGLGVLVARRDALERLKRPWFAGGTVDWVSVAHDRHRLSPGHAGFEDGTPNFLDAAAVEAGFAFLGAIPRERLERHVQALTDRFRVGARALRHTDGSPAVRLYGDGAPSSCTAFNLLTAEGRPVPYEVVEVAAREAGVAIRGGCFCNPGAAEAAFDFARWDYAGALRDLGADFTPSRLQARLGPEATVGALRLSVGSPTLATDIDRALAVLAEVIGRYPTFRQQEDVRRFRGRLAWTGNLEAMRTD